mmetsp:Transcript_89278/g.237304  ORF Transcript_89278/g.237304 Transcript_89278/m.237304 type:complete len:241 (-) Transcript_89278:310-1032(-)
MLGRRPRRAPPADAAECRPKVRGRRGSHRPGPLGALHLLPAPPQPAAATGPCAARTHQPRGLALGPVGVRLCADAASEPPGSDVALVPELRLLSPHAERLPALPGQVRGRQHREPDARRRRRPLARGLPRRVLAGRAGRHRRHRLRDLRLPTRGRHLRADGQLADVLPLLLHRLPQGADSVHGQHDKEQRESARWGRFRQRLGRISGLDVLDIVQGEGEQRGQLEPSGRGVCLQRRQPKG